MQLFLTFPKSYFEKSVPVCAGIRFTRTAHLRIQTRYLILAANLCWVLTTALPLRSARTALFALVAFGLMLEKSLCGEGDGGLEGPVAVREAKVSFISSHSRAVRRRNKERLAGYFSASLGRYTLLEKHCLRISLVTATHSHTRDRQAVCTDEHAFNLQLSCFVVRTSVGNAHRRLTGSWPA